MVRSKSKTNHYGIGYDSIRNRVRFNTEQGTLFSDFPLKMAEGTYIYSFIEYRERFFNKKTEKKERKLESKNKEQNAINRKTFLVFSAFSVEKLQCP